MKILVIEDEQELAAGIMAYLSAEDYRCEAASTYTQALEKLAAFHYDCILLDLTLPGGDGMQLLEAIKAQQKQDGVIIISAKNALEDKIKGLQIGADDYLAKPFHLPELAARIHSVIRRRQFANASIIRQQEITIDLPGKAVSVQDTPVNVTRKEFDLLLYLVSNRNRVVSRAALAEHLSGDMADMMDNHDFVYTHIKNLKKKLQEAGAANYIRTIYGTGYKWEEPASKAV